MHRIAVPRSALDLDGWAGGPIPFDDGSFELVVCRQRLQLLADRQGALREMHRVLRAHGRVEISVWGTIERNPAFAALAASLERHWGAHVAAAVHWLFCLSEPDELRALLAAARFEDIRVDTVSRTMRMASVSELVRRSLSAFPIGAATADLDERDRRRVLVDLEAAMGPLVDTEGVSVPTELVTAAASPGSTGPPNVPRPMGAGPLRRAPFGTGGAGRLGLRCRA